MTMRINSIEGHDSTSTGLEDIKFLWLTANWQSLSAIEYKSLNIDDEDGWAALLLATAYYQTEQWKEFHELIKIAKAKVSNDKVFAQVLYSSLLSSMGRLKILSNDKDCGLAYFKESLSLIVGAEASEKYLNLRYISELSNLGLLPEAAKEINTELENVSKLGRPSKIDAKLNIIKTELELVNHNIMLMHQKNQVYRIETPALGSEKTFEERMAELSPSQLGQDMWVLQQFQYKRYGYFVEFGATDGIMLSNTYLLEKEFGWQGLLAEPNPKFFKKLTENRSSHCSDACISQVTGETVEFILADEFGGIDAFALAGKHREKVSSYKEQDNVIKVQTVTLEDFLIYHNAPRSIDYLSVDTEGSEYSILSVFPFDEWDIKLITVEHNYEPQRESILKLLTGFGYKRIESQWDDWYYKE